MVAKLCSLSHGQPLTGSRSAAMISISRETSREGSIGLLRSREACARKLAGNGPAESPPRGLPTSPGRRVGTDQSPMRFLELTDMPVWEVWMDKPLEGKV